MEQVTRQQLIGYLKRVKNYRKFFTYGDTVFFSGGNPFKALQLTK